MSERVNSVGVVGVGMIGASLVLALRRGGFEGPIYGYDKAPIDASMARHLSPMSSLEALCEASELVVLATPPACFAECAQGLATRWRDEQVLTDVGSVKREATRAVREAFERAGRGLPKFVPGHPIAGSEKSSARAAAADLFDGAMVILTPTSDADATAVERVKSLWAITGATIQSLDDATHDRIFASVSHLPHMVAYALVNYLLDEDSPILQYAGGGLRDYARLAASSPELWRDIGLANRDNLAPILRGYAKEIEGLAARLERNDASGVKEYFSRAWRARESD